MEDLDMAKFEDPEWIRKDEELRKLATDAIIALHTHAMCPAGMTIPHGGGEIEIKFKPKEQSRAH